MKKTILFLAVVLMSTSFVTAQEFVRFGAKGGVNFSTFSGDGHGAFEDPNGRTSFHLGLVGEIPMTTMFSIQPEVLYSGQGYDLVDRENANDIEYQLDYINVPIVAKIYLVEGFAVEAGPQVGFLVNSEIDADPSSLNEGSISLDEDQFNRIDFSIALGASFNFRGGFFINGRYNIGLTDIYDSDFPDNILSDAEARHSVVQVGVGFMF